MKTVTAALTSATLAVTSFFFLLCTSTSQVLWMAESASPKPPSPGVLEVFQCPELEKVKVRLSCKSCHYCYVSSVAH